MKIEKIYTDKDFANKYISCGTHNLPNQEFIELYLKCINNYIFCDLEKGDGFYIMKRNILIPHHNILNVL